MPVQHMRWFDFLAALAPSFGVIAAVYIGLMQAHLQRQNLKQNLYDKRFRVFYAIERVFCDPDATKKAKELLPELERETAEVSFLFGPEIKSLLSEIDAALRDLRWEEHARFETGQTAEDPIPFVNAVKMWDKLRMKTEMLFRPYLQLQQERNWLALLIARANHWIESADNVMRSRYN